MPFPWKPAIYNGVTYELDHLSNITRAVGCNGTERQIQFKFGYHCFTQGRPSGSQERRFIDLDYPDEDRMFCPERWYLSWRLVKFCNSVVRERFLDAGGAQWQHNMPISSISCPYTIFIKICPANGQSPMTILVNSAYLKSNAMRRGEDIRFDVLLNKAAGSDRIPGR